MRSLSRIFLAAIITTIFTAQMASAQSGLMDKIRDHKIKVGCAVAFGVLGLGVFAAPTHRNVHQFEGSISASAPVELYTAQGERVTVQDGKIVTQMNKDGVLWGSIFGKRSVRLIIDGKQIEFPIRKENYRSEGDFESHTEDSKQTVDLRGGIKTELVNVREPVEERISCTYTTLETVYSTDSKGNMTSSLELRSHSGRQQAITQISDYETRLSFGLLRERSDRTLGTYSSEANKSTRKAVLKTLTSCG